MKNTFAIILFITALPFTSCKKATGEKAEVSDAGEVTATIGETLAVDVSNSIINWEGAKPTGTHTGTINLSQGELTVDANKVVGGSFTIDMNSINVTDLEGDMKNRLENHLKGFAEGKEDHFFDVAKHPVGQFEITKVTSLEGDEAATHLVYGNLTLKGTTKEVGFKSNIQFSEGTVQVETPAFTIDRTLWGVNYGSKTVFEDLGDNFVNDEIGLAINLVAGKAAM